MNLTSTSKTKTREGVLKAGDIVAILLGLILSFLLTPLIYGGTVGWIAGYGDAQYAQGFGAFIGILWGPVVAVLCTALSVVSITPGTRVGLLACLQFFNQR